MHRRWFRQHNNRLQEWDWLIEASGPYCCQHEMTLIKTNAQVNIKRWEEFMRGLRGDQWLWQRDQLFPVIEWRARAVKRGLHRNLMKREIWHVWPAPGRLLRIMPVINKKIIKNKWPDTGKRMAREKLIWPIYPITGTPEIFSVAVGDCDAFCLRLRSNYALVWTVLSTFDCWLIVGQLLRMARHHQPLLSLAYPPSSPSSPSSLPPPIHPA